MAIKDQEVATASVLEAEEGEECKLVEETGGLLPASEEEEIEVDTEEATATQKANIQGDLLELLENVHIFLILRPFKIRYAYYQIS